jgi:DeoR/GlpR family transcriptional regulator of sugar metabolism
MTLELPAARALGPERRAEILTELRAHGKVRAADLAAALRVSVDTVRRDLDELASAGLLRRVHGGALPPGPATGGHSARRGRDAPQKAAIARAAAALARDGDLILLDGGTTTLQVARHLDPGLRATAVTNSPPVAAALAEHPGLRVSVVGGELDREMLVTVGASAVAAIRELRADICFLGVCALHPEVGITTTDLEERHVKRAMIDASAQVVALAGPGKLGSAAPFVVGSLDDLTHLAANRSAPAPLPAGRASPSPSSSSRTASPSARSPPASPPSRTASP